MLDLRLRATSVKARQIEIGALNATRLQADRQQAAVTIDQLQAYGGGLKGTLKAEASTPPAYDVDLDGPRHQRARRVRRACRAQPRRRPGSGARWRSRPRGSNVRELVGALGGDGSVTVKDGAVLGINIAGMLRQIMTLGLDSAAPTSSSGPTLPRPAAASRSQNGILRTQDLSPERAGSAAGRRGFVDLPQRTVDMRVTPQLATTLRRTGC